MMSWSIKLSGRPKLTSYFAIWILLQVAVVISEQPDGFLLPQSWHQRFGYNRDKGAGESQDLDDNSKFLRLYQKEASQVDQHRSHTSVNPLVVWGRRLNFPRSGDSDPDVSQVSRPEKYVDLFPSSDMNDKEISSARFNGDEEFGFDKLSVSQADLEKLENGKTSLEKLANLADRDAILRKQGSEESSWRKLASIVDKDPSLRKLGNTADIEENWRKIANLADKDSGLGYLGSSKAFSDDLDDSDLLLQNVAGKEPPHIHWPTDKVKSKMLLGMKSPDDDVTDINSVVIRGDFGEDIKGDINKTTEYLFEFFYNTSSLEKKAVRVTVSSPDSDYTNPLLVVVRQQRGVLSWQLPLEPPSNTIILEEYRTVSRTLCPVKNYKVSYGGALDSKQRLFIDISTSSPTNISFSVKVDFEEQFHIELHKEQTFEVTPSQPVFYEFLFPDEVDMILVKANAEDDFCAMVAIQNITCPVFDCEENVQYGNFYQTMTYQAGITVRKQDYPNGLYIVIVMLSNDEPCSSYYQHVYRTRKKNVTLLIEEKITKSEYLAAIFAGLGFCAFFYVVTILLACISYIRAKHKQPRERSMLDDSIIGSPDDISSPVASPSYGIIREQNVIETKDHPSPLPRTVSDSSLDEDDIDMLTDAESEKEIYRTKAFLYVSDLARKDMRVLKKKSQLYIWGLLTVGVFYAVPVMQLVITYQNVLDVTGNQDLCYYNFWCAHPLGPLSDFNHVFSNISYILFGILFIGVCARRNHHHQLAVQADYKIDKYYGIPQHFGIFYAMGGSLIMEGLLSACYHICPNNSNYQFDTSFMYVISVLSMLKIYQTRHPDINASACAAYAALAFAVLLGVIGVLAGTLLFWIIFGFIHVISCLLLSGHIYYMGRWKCDLGLFKRFKAWCLSELGDPWGIFRPMYVDRMVLLLLGNAANWGLAIYGMIWTPRDFASYLLIIFLTNLLLYMAFYIIMKLRHGERLQLQSVVYLVLCLLGWSAAIVFYTKHTTTWELTPAHSRQFNQECILLHFYDTHDVWHFLSAGGMFFGFMVLLTLDDDRAQIPRERIPVF